MTRSQRGEDGVLTWIFAVAARRVWRGSSWEPHRQGAPLRQNAPQSQRNETVKSDDCRTKRVMNEERSQAAWPRAPGSALMAVATPDGAAWGWIERAP